MATLKIADFLKEQQKRLDQARDQLVAVRKASEAGKGVPPEILREGREREIAELKGQLSRARATRDQVVARYEGEIKRLTDAIARLEQDGKTIDEVIGRGRVKAARTPAKAAKSAAKKKPRKSG